jgi:hypothetical protein
MEDIEFDIARCDLTKGIGTNYRFIFPNQSNGEAQVILRVFDQYRKAPYYQILLDKGVDPEDALAHLSHFYPNGIFHNEARMRKGVGSKVLETIINDVKDCDVKIMLVRVRAHSMKEFLQRKHGFENLYQAFFYKKL